MSPRVRIFVTILLVALLLRLAAAVFWQELLCKDGPFFFGDTESYWDLARTIAEGKAYEFSEDRWQLFRTPGYPVFLAPLFLLFGENPPVYAARFLGAILGTLTVAVAAILGNRLFPGENSSCFSSASLCAAAIVAVEPTQVLTSILILSESLFCLLMVLQIFFRVGALRHHRPWVSSLCSGICFAAAVYTRPSWLYFVLFTCAFEAVFFLSRQSRRADFVKQLSYEFVILAVFCTLMCPWWVRNYRITGHFVATSLQSGPSLYDGLSPEATGASDMEFVHRFREEERAHPSMNPETEIYEYRLDQRMKNAAVDWAKTHPREVAGLAVVKFVRMWNVWPNEPSFSKLPVRIMIFVSFVPVMLFAIWGTMKTWTLGFEYWLCWIPAVYFTALHVIFVSSLRYRIPPMILLSLLAAFAFTSFLANRRL